MRSVCSTSLGGCSKGTTPVAHASSALSVPSCISWHVGVQPHVRASKSNDTSFPQSSETSASSNMHQEQTSKAWARGGDGGRAHSSSSWSGKQQQQQKQQQQRRPHHADGSQSRQQGTQQHRGQQQQWRQQQQQQPVLLFQGGGSSSSSGTGASAAAPDPRALAALLTSKISRSEDLQQLQQVLLLHKNSLSPVQLSAAISRAAKLHPNQLTERQQKRQQQQQHVQQLRQLVDWLLQRFLADLNQATFLEVSCVIGGLARLGYNTRNDVMSACLDATRHAMGGEGVENKQLLQLGWGLARLALKPDDDWLQGFEAETYRRLPTLNNIETANALWVFAKWAAKPSDTWLAAYLAHLPSQLLNMQPPELCSVVWAAAMLQLQLPVPVLDSILLEAQVKFGGFSGQGFGTLAWSLARMDIRPKRLWLQDFVRHTADVLPGLSQQQQQQQQQQLTPPPPAQQRDQVFTNIIWALGCWEHNPPQTWMQQFCRCVVPQLLIMTPQGLTITAVGLAELNHKPPQPFTCYLLELFHQQLPAATAAQAAEFIWALPRLLLPRTHSQAVSAAAAAGSGELQQRQQQQQQQPARDGFNAAAWLRQYCWLLQDIADHILPGLEKMFCTQLVDAVCGFGDLGFFPGVAWMDAHEVNLNRHLDQLSTVQINLVKQAYVRLEQQQQQQQRLLHPEQLQLLQQQQQQQVAAAAAATAGSGSGVVIGAGGGWQSGRLAASAAAAAAATAAEVTGMGAAATTAAAGGSAAAAPAAAAAAAGRTDSWSSNEQQKGPRNRRLEPPAWSRDSADDNTSSRGRGRGRSSSSSTSAWVENSSNDEDDDISINEEPLELPKLPNRPRAARIRLQKIREAEREERQQEQEEWRQRWQQMPSKQRWRVARPGEYEGR